MRKKYYAAVAGGAFAAGALVIALLATTGLRSVTDAAAIIFYGMGAYLIVTELLMRVMDRPKKKGDFKTCTYGKDGNCTVRNYR